MIPLHSNPLIVLSGSENSKKDLCFQVIIYLRMWFKITDE